MTLPYWTLHEAPPDSPKKWAVRVPTSSGRGKVVLFGARGYEDFTIHKDKARRSRYRTRHEHDRLNDPYAPGFWAMWALWGESDDLDTAFAAAVQKAKKLLARRRRNPEDLLESDMTRRNPHRDPAVEAAIEAFMETADYVDDSPAPRLNGIHDLTTLKGVFLGGGPGSGKSYTVSQLFGLTPGLPLSVSTTLGLKIVNSDVYFEKFLRDMDIDPKSLATMSDEEFKRLTEGPGSPRERAKVVRDKFLRTWLTERLGLIIDGTGDDFEKIERQKTRLEDLGYDTCMVFVNTSLETAKYRNRMRPRSLKDEVVEQIWTACQTNLEAFSNLFGERFILIDGNQSNSVTPRIRRTVMAFIDSEIENPIGQEWLVEHGVHRRNPEEDSETDMVLVPRHNPVREHVNFSHYEQYANRLTDDQLHYAIIDALNALKVARTWDDGGAGEAKYLDQISVLRREQRARVPRQNPEWARKVGGALYRGTRKAAKYAKEVSTDLYHGVREAHRSYRDNPAFDQYEFRVSDSFLPALFYGDTSGLSAADEQALDHFYAQVQRLGPGHFAVIEENVGFGQDEITGLGSDLALVAWMVPTT